MRLALLLASAALAIPALANAAPARPAVSQTADANQQLKQLFHESDEAQLKLTPLAAIFRGDMRYADRLGDFGTDAFYNQARANSESDLRKLHAIPRAKLTPTNQIAYDVFEWQANDNLKSLTPQMLALTAVRPVDHFFGFHVFYPTFASGQGAAPFKTVADYENNLKRHRDYIKLIDVAIGRFREGMKSGVVQPKLIVIDPNATWDVSEILYIERFRASGHDLLNVTRGGMDGIGNIVRELAEKRAAN